jgi:hypothetical protein
LAVFKKDKDYISPQHATLVRELDIPELIKQRESIKSNTPKQNFCL